MCEGLPVGLPGSLSFYPEDQHSPRGVRSSLPARRLSPGLFILIRIHVPSTMDGIGDQKDLTLEMTLTVPQWGATSETAFAT